MKYAIIETGGKQFKVSEGDVLDIELLNIAEKKVRLDKVLMVVDGSTVKFGKPVLSDVKVSAEIVGEKKGEKIRIVRFGKAEGWKRTTGHRQKYATIKIEKIEL